MSAPRRTKAERGIYYRAIRVDGKPARIYEITYTDRHGRQRWETVKDGGLQAARALRGVRLTSGGPDAAAATDTYASVATAMMSAKRQLRPKTRQTYEWALHKHILPWKPNRAAPALGDLPIAAITTDHIAQLLAGLRDAGMAEWSVRAIGTPLHGVFKHAIRRSIITDDPWLALTPHERPGSQSAEDMHILDRDEISEVLDHAETRYRTLLLVAIFTGLRMGELLALRWGDVDTKAGVLRITEQLTEKGRRAKLKTKKAKRDVVLARFVAQALLEHRLASPHSTSRDAVFAAKTGPPLQRKVLRGALARAVKAANTARDELEQPKPAIRRVRFHDLRHTFASILIAQGEDVLYVSRQLGHENASTTLDVYGDLFDQARHAERARDRLDDGFGEQFG